MLKMFEDGKNPYQVEDFLKSKGDEFLLSRPTLYKHYNNYKKATQLGQKPKEQAEGEKFRSKIEKELWDTINTCQEKMSDKTLSPKDWQYFDQQKQSAIEKLMKIKEMKGTTEDGSQILSKFFQKFLIDKALNEQQEEEKDDVTQEDDKHPGGSGSILPGESLSV